MTVLGRGLIFQPVLASLPYTQACTYYAQRVKGREEVAAEEEEEGEEEEHTQRDRQKDRETDR